MAVRLAVVLRKQKNNTRGLEHTAWRLQRSYPDFLWRRWVLRTRIAIYDDICRIDVKEWQLSPGMVVVLRNTNSNARRGAQANEENAELKRPSGK